MKRLLVALLVILIFSGCSSIDEFMIYNLQDKIINLKYVIDPGNPFGIFTTKPYVNKLNKNGEVDYPVQQDPAFVVFSGDTLKIQLLPFTALQIGAILNQPYKKYDQRFFNGRSFNLQYMEITNEKSAVKIRPDTFDNYFKRENSGTIIYKIKK